MRVQGDEKRDTKGRLIRIEIERTMFDNVFAHKITRDEVTIVGAGPAGLAIALELDRRGISSRILESGGLHRDKSLSRLSQATVLSEATHDPLEAVSAQMFGGTSNLWAGACVPFDPIDLSRRQFLSSTVWPIEYQKLARYYEPACAFLDAGPSEFSDHLSACFDQTTFQANNLARFAKIRRTQVKHMARLKTSTRISISLNTVVTDVLVSGQGKVEAVRVASSNGDLVTTLSVRTLIIAAGGLETTKLLLNMQRSHPALFGGSEGHLGRYYMGHVTGSIADIRFARPEYTDLFDFALQRGTFVRRRFQPTEKTQTELGLSNTALWPEGAIADPRHESAMLSTLYLVVAANRIGRSALPEVMRRRHTGSSLTSASDHLRNFRLGNWRNSYADIRTIVKRLAASPRPPGFFIRNRKHQYRLIYHAEHLPHGDSRVRLTHQKDYLGRNQLAIDLRFQQEDAASVAKLHYRMSQSLENSAFARVELSSSKPDDIMANVLRQARHGTHQLGTTRMALSAADGIVNGDLQTFDLPNMYLCSGSVFPTSGQANPTLTVTALGLRLAAFIALNRDHI